MRKKPKKKPIKRPVKRHHPKPEHPKPKFSGRTIVIADGVQPNPDPAHASRGAQEAVRFHNTTNRGRTVKFNLLWPFSEPPETIGVLAHRFSKTYHIYANQPLGGCPYQVEPSLNIPDDNGPPADPQVDVDG